MLPAPSGIFRNLRGMSGKCPGSLYWWLGRNPEYECAADCELAGTAA